MPITGIRLKDGTSVTVNPNNPRDCHTIRQTLLWVTVRCAATGAVRRIGWKSIERVRRTSDAGDYWTP